MMKRYLWSLIIAAMIMLPVGFVNYYIYPSAEHIPANQRTAAQVLSIQQRLASFITITIIEMGIFFIIGFQITDRYFTLHPDRQTLFDIFKLRHPDIDDKYLNQDK